MDDESDGYRHESVPNDLHKWRLTGYDALQFIRTSNPWVWSNVVDDLVCYYCGSFSGEAHADTCEWKRARTDED